MSIEYIAFVCVYVCVCVCVTYSSPGFGGSIWPCSVAGVAENALRLATEARCCEEGDKVDEAGRDGRCSRIEASLKPVDTVCMRLAPAS